MTDWDKIEIKIVVTETDQSFREIFNTYFTRDLTKKLYDVHGKDFLKELEKILINEFDQRLKIVLTDIKENWHKKV